MTQQRLYRGVAPDDRRRARREALIEAALDCMVDDAVELSVRAICTKARLTPRYFYESFANLDELLVALVDEVSTEVIAGGLSSVAAAGPDLDAQCRAAFAGSFAALTRDPRKARAMLVVASGSELLQERRRRLVLEYAEQMLAFLATQLALDPAQTEDARTSALYMVGGTFELVQSWLSGQVDTADPEAFSDRVGALLASTLRVLFPQP